MEIIQSELRNSIHELESRCLYFASKRSAELLSSVNHQIELANQNLNASSDYKNDLCNKKSITNSFNSTIFDMSAILGKENRSKIAYSNSHLNTFLNSTLSTSQSISYKQTSLSDQERLAKIYFDMKEFHLVDDCLKSKFNQSPFSIYLRYYARFMIQQRNKLESELIESENTNSTTTVNNLDNQDPCSTPINSANSDSTQRSQSGLTANSSPTLISQPETLNTQLERDVVKSKIKSNSILNELKNELNIFYDEDKLDAFGIYLLGMILKNLRLFDEARQKLVQSVNLQPLNQSAQKCLASLCYDKDCVSSLELNEHWMQEFFLVDVYIQLQLPESDITSHLQGLIQVFPESNLVLSLRALTYYMTRDFDEAHSLFEILQQRSPYSLDFMDIYSNVLFVKEMKRELALLAHQAIEIDKYRPETSFIIANLLSLKGEHEKAILYFQRALKLDPSYLGAQTLMGHEYVELKNSSAAVSAYRAAVNLNPRDYRAQYGLGQAFEIMFKFNYSVYYYTKAAHLRPYDSRMQCALASAYEHLERYDDAIKCYVRAESNNDQEGVALGKLAKLFEKRGDLERTAQYYQLVIKRLCESNSSSILPVITNQNQATNKFLNSINQSSNTVFRHSRINQTLQQQQSRDANLQEHTSIDKFYNNYSPLAVEAILFMAEYCKKRKFYDDAERYCNRLMDVGGYANEQAKMLSIEIRRLREQSQNNINLSQQL